MWAFMKSVLLGTFAAAALPSVLTFAIAVNSLPEGLNGDGRLFPSFWLALLPTMVALPLVLGASLLFGVPLTMLLKRVERESAGAYAICGAVLGLFIPLAILMIIRAPAGYWMAFLGAFSGMVTALVWWQSAREPNVR